MKPKGLSKLDSLRRRLPELPGRRSKNVSDSKEPLLLNKPDWKEKNAKLMLELLLKLNAKKERPNSNNGESREKEKSKPEELRPRT